MKTNVKKSAVAVLAATALLCGNIAVSPAFSPAISPITLSASAATQSTTTSGNITYTYTVSNSAVTIDKITVSSSAASGLTVSIPKKLGGYVVKKIGDYAVQTNGNKINYLIIPSNVEEIGLAAFQKATEMTKIQIPATLKRIKGNAFGPDTKVESLYIQSNSVSTKVNSAYIDNNIASKVSLLENAGDIFSLTDSTLGMVELIDSLAYSPFADTVCKEKATKIVNQYVASNATNLQKMQQIYNYFVTTKRYSAINMSTDNDLNNLHQKAIGTMFFNSGVCAGFSDAVCYYGEAAGLDVKRCVGNGHAWNLFRPNSSSKYYIVDTTDNQFCTGSTAGSQTATDGTVCQLATECIDSTILVQVKNNCNSETFNVKLYDTNNTAKTYTDYAAVDYSADLFSIDQLSKNKEMFLYMDANTYYSLEIKDSNGNVLLSKDYALNFSGSNTISFKDSFGNSHTCKLSINSADDAYNKKCCNHARFVIEIN